MKDLFNGMDIPSFKETKLNSSKEISSRRYNETFFTRILFKLYHKLHFISAKFDLDIKDLLELLLENIYKEEKFSKFLILVKKFEADFKPRHVEWSVVGPVLKLYLENKELSQQVETEVFIALELLMSENVFLEIENVPIQKLNVLHIYEHREVKFYSKTSCAGKIKKINKSLNAAVDSKNPLYSELLNHMSETYFLSDRVTNREIERLLTRYFSQFCQKL